MGSGLISASEMSHDPRPHFDLTPFRPRSSAAARIASMSSSKAGMPRRR